MYRHFPGQQQVYLRWYQQWSAGFMWEPSGTGLIGVKTSTSYPQFYPFAVGADGTFAIQAQVVAEQAWGSENFFVNRGDPVSFTPGRWYCLEVFVKLNTPGAADASLAALDRRRAEAVLRRAAVSRQRSGGSGPVNRCHRCAPRDRSIRTPAHRGAAAVLVARRLRRRDRAHRLPGVPAHVPLTTCR
jgi:hypothetical protein